MNANVVFSASRVNKNKNHKIGIETFAKLNDPNIYYVICGRGPLIEAHKKLARKLGVGDRVVLAGYRTDVADFYCFSVSVVQRRTSGCCYGGHGKWIAGDCY